MVATINRGLPPIQKIPECKYLWSKDIAECPYSQRAENGVISCFNPETQIGLCAYNGECSCKKEIPVNEDVAKEKKEALGTIIHYGVYKGLTLGQILESKGGIKYLYNMLFLDYLYGKQHWALCTLALEIVNTHAIYERT